MKSIVLSGPIILDTDARTEKEKGYQCGSCFGKK